MASLHSSLRISMATVDRQRTVQTEIYDFARLYIYTLLMPNHCTLAKCFTMLAKTRK